MNIKSAQNRYLLYGALFGCLFPVFGSLIEARMQFGSVHLHGVLRAQAETPLLWIIDTAPLFLGLFAWLLGRATDRLLEVQEKREEEQGTLIQKLENRNVELAGLNEAMDGVIYTASHDLKTPVVNFKSMLSMLKVLLQRPDNEKMVTAVVEKMELAADRMQETLTDLLEVSRVERHLEQDFVELEVRKCLEHNLLPMEALIRQEKAEIDMTGIEAPTVFYSRRSFDSILQNLLSNAIKYRHPDRNPHIRIATRHHAGKFEMTVEDNGLGIDLEKQQHKLFKMFSRLHNQSEGTGVGLYIVKRTVERSGGDILVDSAIDKGTTFTIQLPLIPETNDQTKIRPAD